MKSVFYFGILNYTEFTDLHCELFPHQLTFIIWDMSLILKLWLRHITRRVTVF